MTGDKVTKNKCQREMYTTLSLPLALPRDDDDDGVFVNYNK